MGQAALTGLGNHKVITAGRSGDVDHIVDITNEQQSLTLDVITEMSSIPQQKSFDDFEFLEGY